MSYRDHKDLVHTWIHQWTDEEWNKKGAVRSTRELFPSKKWSYEGSHRGGIYGCTYRSYSTVIACVAWSNKLRQHVVLLEHNCDCGWTKTTSKTIRELRCAIPGTRRIIEITSMLCSGILHDVVRRDAEAPASAEHIKKISKSILSQIDEFWDSSERKITQQAWRSKFCLLLDNLVELTEVFGHNATGISAAKVAWAKEERKRITLWDPAYAKLTTKEIAEKLAKQRIEVEKASLVRWLKRTRQNVEYTATHSSISQYLTDCFAIDVLQHPEDAIIGILLATPCVDFSHSKRSAPSELSTVADFLRQNIAARSMFWDKEKASTGIKKSQAKICAQSGITVTQKKDEADIRFADLLVFCEETDKCVSLRHCAVPLREAKVLLHAYVNGKNLHGKSAGSYTVVAANKNEVQVGCHHFSGEYLRLLYKSMCDDLTPKEKDLREKGIQFISEHILCNTHLLCQPN